jgi:hypothetical protein
LDSVPPSGKIGKCEIKVSWQCGDLADVKYQVEAFTKPINSDAGEESLTKQMTGFLPSQNGWPFDNRFAKVPPFKLIGNLKFGDASNGLCGGMVYAALDYFFAGLDVPTIPEEDLSKYKSPMQGKIFEYFGKRLFNSFDIPLGVWNYIELMHPDFPDYKTSKSNSGMIPRSRAWRMVRQEWPIIKAKLDTGQPCPLGLIRTKSKKLSDLGKNHQVLAYAYDLNGDDLTLFIYDPNFHHDDNVTLKLNIKNPERKVNVSYSDNKPVYCFFHTCYTFSMPPESVTTPGRIILFEDENFCGKSIDVVLEHSDLSTHKARNFNNCTSSFVILSGMWSFYQNTGFDTPIAHKGKHLILGPGAYARVTDVGIQDDEITSLQSVSTKVLKRIRR